MLGCSKNGCGGQGIVGYSAIYVITIAVKYSVTIASTILLVLAGVGVGMEILLVVGAVVVAAVVVVVVAGVGWCVE